MEILVALLGRPLLRPYPNLVAKLNLKIQAVSVHIRIFQMDGQQLQHRRERQLEHQQKHRLAEPPRHRRRGHVIESENEKTY